MLLELAVAEPKIQTAGPLLQCDRCDAGGATATFVDLPHLERRPASISRAVIDHELSLLSPLRERGWAGGTAATRGAKGSHKPARGEGGV